MKIYVVFGQTGEYSDRKEWMVCAYRKEEKAQARISELENLMLTLGVDPGLYWVSGKNNLEKLVEVSEAMRKHPRGDPAFDTDYTGTMYYYASTDLRTAL